MWVTLGLDGETQMNTNGRVNGEEPNVVASFAGLSHDVIELAELQAELFALDVKDTSQGARTALLLSAAGILVLLGSIPVALVTIAVLLVEQFGWSNAAGFGAATAVGILLGAGILAAAWARFRTSLVTLHRSRDELRRNIAWVKTSLRNRAQPNPTETN